jgi:hypothetical protein
MSHPIHHALQVRTSREKPQRVWVLKLCTRTPKSMPDALTAGSHTRVRKVLREIGVPTLVLTTTFR